MQFLQVTVILLQNLLIPAWLEAEKEVVKNELNALGQELENAFTEGMSFDFLATRMERAQSLQEEWLTTTNKIYETNKLINKA